MRINNVYFHGEIREISIHSGWKNSSHGTLVHMIKLPGQKWKSDVRISKWMGLASKFCWDNCLDHYISWLICHSIQCRPDQTAQKRNSGFRVYTVYHSNSSFKTYHHSVKWTCSNFWICKVKSHSIKIFKGVLKLSILRKNFTTRQFEFFFVYFSQKTGFYISCKLSLGEKYENINLSSTEFAQWLVKVKYMVK